jgi:tellurite resistance protein
MRRATPEQIMAAGVWLAFLWLAVCAACALFAPTDDAVSGAERGAQIGVTIGIGDE